MNGRHPLLLGGAEPVVPFDLEMLGGKEHTLLISGPNTGGKTVLLKAVGLAAALAQSGIMPPVGAGSRFRMFGAFFADIGDRQSIAASLSTFSAHVAMLRQVLDQADAGTLVLLDEIGSGTDPAEGAALAAATLAALTRRATLTLATTHLGRAQGTGRASTAGVVNASLQFDAATLTPTYRFLKGVPGRSYGLAIARRLGVGSDILADAEARVPDAERRLDALLAWWRSESASSKGTRRHRRSSDRARLLEARLRGQEESRQRVGGAAAAGEGSRTGGRKQAEAYLLDARQKVEEALAAARGAADEAAAREARRMVEEGIRAEGEATRRDGENSETEKTERSDAVAIGDRVRLNSGATGEVLEARSDGKTRRRPRSRCGWCRTPPTWRPYRRLRKGPRLRRPLRCRVLSVFSVVSRDRPPRTHRRRSRDGDAGGGGRGSAG